MRQIQLPLNPARYDTAVAQPPPPTTSPLDRQVLLMCCFHHLPESVSSSERGREFLFWCIASTHPPHVPLNRSTQQGPARHPDINSTVGALSLQTAVHWLPGGL